MVRAVTMGVRQEGILKAFEILPSELTLIA